MNTLEFTLALPARYRSREVLDFHGRDPERIAERVESNCLWKGVTVDGTATLIELELCGERATCRVEADGDAGIGLKDRYRAAAAGMLGLLVDPAPFEAASRNDTLMGPIVARQAGLRVPQASTPFEALSWAVIGQQINLPFAIQLRRALIRAAGRQHSSGLWCYPEAADVARMDADALCALKFSRAKAETLIRVAQLSRDGSLPLDRWAAGNGSIEEMEAALLAVKGIGPWTVNYVLLRGFGVIDRSLHGDAAVRTALQRALGSSERLDESRARTLLERYRPYRSLAAAHLWSSLHAAP